MLYSIVIPCYKSSKTIRKVVEMTMQEMDRLDRREYEFVLVDDCSPDDGETMAALMGLVRDYACIFSCSKSSSAKFFSCTFRFISYIKSTASVSDRSR